MIVCDRDHLGLVDASPPQRLRPPAAELRGRTSRSRGSATSPLRAVFIRAPWIEEHGPDVEVLAEVDGHPVAVREGNVLACAFHPELTDDSRLHAAFMAMAPPREVRGSPSTRGGRR